MIFQGQVGAPGSRSITPGTTPPARLGQLSDVIVSELHGRYYETTYNRNMFTAALTAGTTTSVGLSTTQTGLLLLNPNNSSVNLVVNKVGYCFLVAFAAASAIGIQAGTQSTALLSGLTTTNTQTKSNLIGNPTSSQALTYSAATTTAPWVQMLFGTGLTGAITTTPAVYSFFDIEGGLIIPPGGWIATYTSTASGASSTLASFTYEEVPL
jgi:hypothetical protein